MRPTPRLGVRLAGAFYGYDGIPKRRRDAIAIPDTILAFADRLCTSVPTDQFVPLPLD
jgi:hypothetical protein